MRAMPPSATWSRLWAWLELVCAIFKVVTSALILVPTASEAALSEAFTIREPEDSLPIELAASAALIVIAVSSREVRARARELGDAVDGSHMLVHAIGALAEPDDQPVSAVLHAETPCLQTGVLAGPALPTEPGLCSHPAVTSPSPGRLAELFTWPLQ